MIDLHCHSFFSDGIHSPEELLHKALESGIKILALTDHDTIKGLDDLHAANKGNLISIINGIEISCSWKKQDIHVLGLNIDRQCDILNNLVESQTEARIERAKQIGQKLEPLVKDAYEKACLLAGHTRVGRPHFAKVLINEAVVSDMQTAFKRFLKRGKLAYVPVNWADFSTAISAITAASGDAVLAHPLKYKLTRTKLMKLIDNFKEAGGRGMEVVSGETNDSEINDLANIALHYDLFASAGSDFHGDSISRIALGRQRQLPVNCKPIWQQWTI
ncbi:MAG: PHP domain-containing protein [Proteobacteria bacterium]|nr:PHP domain-containing protein [Pseudomonadota bacterium]